jgi:type IV secretion system protein VirB10
MTDLTRGPQPNQTAGEAMPTDETAAADDAGELAGERNVAGERGAASVNRVRSLQSRASNLMAGGLTMVLGIGALTWYYSSALSRSARRSEMVQAATRNRAQGEMPLPSLGHIELPRPAAPPDGSPAQPRQEGVLAAGGGTASQPSLLLPPVPENSAAWAGRPPLYSAQPTPAPAKTPEELAAQRRLAGSVFVRDSDNTPLATASAATTVSSPVTVPEITLASGLAPTAGPATPSEPPPVDTPLAAALRPTPIAAARARVVPTRRFLLPKGAFIDCTLETAIDSTLPGMTTCVTATDTFSADGSVVLLERGTKLVGETRGQVQQGMARVFVLWTEARTPGGVVVPLDSPGTDELGRSGLTGEVDRHFWDRFGAAILVSTIDGALQTAAQKGGGSTVVLNPTGSQEVLTEILRSTVSIPPTVTKKNGERVEVLVARDIDFRSVYELR